MRKLVLIIHNVRSCHNVGSMLRTADALAAAVYMTGYTPYPLGKNDKRLPHIAAKTARQIEKTSLGAEKSVLWNQNDHIDSVIKNLKTDGFEIVALEQDKTSIGLPGYQPGRKVAIIVGREREGLEQKILKQAEVIVEIPMLGQKESLNVSNAAAIALYHCRFHK